MTNGHTDMEIFLGPELSEKLAQLYAAMEQEYDRLAQAMDFSCRGCPDNCCDSYFLHYTYAEWAYIWQGLRSLPLETRERIKARAGIHLLEGEKSLAMGERPRQMCPFNEQGSCMLYAHRMIICRLHGVPATLTQPNGRQLDFPGCFRCQELMAGKEEVPFLDRTEFLRDMALIELELRSSQSRTLPKTKLTLAQMIVMGPPCL